MGAGSNPGSPASLPAPCLWPGKADEDGPKLWDPAPAWETRKRLLALDRHSIGRCTHLGSESSDGGSPLCLSSVYTRLSNKKIIKIIKSDIQRGGETERKTFYLMIHSPSCRNGWC